MTKEWFNPDYSLLRSEEDLKREGLVLNGSALQELTLPQHTFHYDEWEGGSCEWLKSEPLMAPTRKVRKIRSGKPSASLQGSIRSARAANIEFFVGCVLPKVIAEGIISPAMQLYVCNVHKSLCGFERALTTFERCGLGLVINEEDNRPLVQHPLVAASHARESLRRRMPVSELFAWLTRPSGYIGGLGDGVYSYQGAWWSVSGAGINSNLAAVMEDEKASDILESTILSLSQEGHDVYASGFRKAIEAAIEGWCNNHDDE